ncbi:hypothetical protein QII94_gp4, partial [ssRNA phage SRR6960551_1]
MTPAATTWLVVVLDPRVKPGAKRTAA